MHSIWVTRDETPAGPLCTALQSAGLAPICEPVLTRRILIELSPHLEKLGPLDWLVLTSTYAIDQLPAQQLHCRIAIVGEASRAALEARGHQADLVSSDETGATLWNMLQANTAGAARICYPRSSLARAPEHIGTLELDSPILYETTPLPLTAERLSRVKGAAAAAVTSPSAAEVLASLLQAPRCASIGPTTTSALLAGGIQPWLESPTPSFKAFAAAIAAALPRPKPPTAQA